MRYDLEERTSKFGEDIIDFAKKIPINPITHPLVPQLIKAGTSIGANYHEANEASSPKDFRNKIKISNKEARETKFWLRMVVRACPEMTLDAKPFRQEAHELNLIFSKIIKNTKVE
jgi:four helix bundle protein